MRISISNLAWETKEDASVFELLRKKSISSIEILPTRYFPNPLQATRQDAEHLKRYFTKEGVHVSSFQALLYGRPDLKLFGSPEERKSTREYLRHEAELASWLGAGRLVFGSPRNRQVPDGMDQDTALALATEFFRDLAESLHDIGVTICIEPNAVEYGCNFCVKTSAAAGLVRAVEHPSFRLHLDSGVMQLNDEDPAEIVMAHADIIDHVHASEPKLEAVGHGEANRHRILAKALANQSYGGYVSIEMLPPSDGLGGIEKSLDFTIKTYGYVDT
jgi:sugar phosphate isomerase/epimerase